MADDPKPEVIEQEMAHTRSSLVEKIAALESQVVGTVQSATTAVQETVANITNAVQDTTTSVKEGLFGVQHSAQDALQGLTGNVKEAFDVTSHVRENPVPMVIGAAVAGFVTGLLAFGPRTRGLPGGMSEGTEPAYGGGYAAPAPGYQPAYAAAVQPAAAVPSQPKRAGWFDELLAKAGQEVVKLGEQALSQAVAQAKTALDQNVPKLVDNLVATGTQKVQGLVGDGLGTHPTTRRM